MHQQFTTTFETKPQIRTEISDFSRSKLLVIKHARVNSRLGPLEVKVEVARVLHPRPQQVQIGHTQVGLSVGGSEGDFGVVDLLGGLDGAQESGGSPWIRSPVVEMANSCNRA